MRSTVKTLDFYKRYQDELEAIITRSFEWLKIGRVPVDRIKIAKDEIRSSYLKLCISKYSSGDSLEPVLTEYTNIFSVVTESWPELWKLKDVNGDEFDQYILSAYDEMLWMLSIGYLLDVPNDQFKKLVEVIDRDKVKDYLFEFIIRAKLPDRQPIGEESYRDFYGVPETFAKLREAISGVDATTAEKLIKVFLQKEWYKNHKDAGWYNSHKSKHDTYFGYWSFESAAVVKIMRLDDSSFRDNQYYPKDLLDVS